MRGTAPSLCFARSPTRRRDRTATDRFATCNPRPPRDSTMTRFPLLAAIGVLSVTASIVTAPAQMMAPTVVPSGAGLGGAAGIGGHLGATPLGGSGLGVGSAPGG